MAKKRRVRIMKSPLVQKPSFQVPSMAEIEALPWNGFNVVSTFSGCGGSCLGYRMAGYRVLWASEFIPAAQKVYKANHPNSVLDTRDIRQVQPEDILSAIGMEVGEIDILDGSPPCASFSTAGKREKGWGVVKKYSDTHQRVDDLFFEYARILKGLQPKVFVAENVKGLVTGAAKGYFLEILQELKGAGYRVKAKVLDGKWLGVPQNRARLIFVGVREDLGLEPIHPRPLPYQYTVKDALPWVVKAVHDTRGQYSEGDITDRPASTVLQANPRTHWVEEENWDLLPPSRQGDNAFNTTLVEPDKPCGTVTISSPGNDLAVPIPGRQERRKFTIAELKRICAFPDDFILSGTFAQQWERLGRAVPPVMMSHISHAIADNILSQCVE